MKQNRLVATMGLEKKVREMGVVLEVLFTCGIIGDNRTTSGIFVTARGELNREQTFAWVDVTEREESRTWRHKVVQWCSSPDNVKKGRKYEIQSRHLQWKSYDDFWSENIFIGSATSHLERNNKRSQISWLRPVNFLLSIPSQSSFNHLFQNSEVGHQSAYSNHDRCKVIEHKVPGQCLTNNFLKVRACLYNSPP